MIIKKDIDIIILSQFRWDGPYSSISIALAKEFAKTNRVFFLNHPYSWWDLGPFKGWSRRKTTFTKAGVFQKQLMIIDPPVILPINFLSNNALYHRLARQNAARLEQAIQETIDLHEIKQYIYINCFDPYYPVKPVVSPRPLLHIYQCVDNIAKSVYLKKHGPRLEEKAIAEADLCLVTSIELRRLKKVFNHDTRILHNAADVNLFRKAMDQVYERPKELSGHKGDVIGFIGNLDQQRVDYSLLLHIAKNNRDKILLLVGPVNNTIAKTIGLMDQTNVIFTGGKKIEQLPPYLQYMDCCIIPFNCNELTRSIYPLKINEYLAAGKPVVSTPFSDDIQTFKNEISLADTPTTFVRAINQAIESNNPALQKQRSHFAAANSWSRRVNEFWKIIDLELHTPGNKVPL